MTVQTYCVEADIVALIGQAAVNAALDDNQNSSISAGETAILTTIIEYAAGEINRLIRHQYVLANCAGNEWLKWANAVIAAYNLRCRRTNPPEGSISDNYHKVMQILENVRWGRDQIPGKNPDFDHLPSVSNFTPQLGRAAAPIRVNRDESTTSEPVGGRKRFGSDEPGYSGLYWY